MSRQFAAWILALLVAGANLFAAGPRPPNIIIIMADDLGYGDLACYGHPSIRTPHLDRMAAEGMRFTDFYSGAAVCTPSRAALLTGRLPVRSGMASERRRVLFPDSVGGLPDAEITLAEALREQGYATACIGKWHLGHRPEFLPDRHGFDYFFGLPYSNDMDAAPNIPRGAAGSSDPRTEYWRVPLLRNGQEVERPADQATLTRRYTEESIRFIRQHKEQPFLLYLPHSMPHVPLFASKDFQGRSLRGRYGDVVEEIDWSIGEIMRCLRDENLAERTLVIFTSDNGPWLTQGLAGGSAGLLREGKGSTWEGGVRVPAIAWWPGKIQPGQVTSALACSMDLFTTALSLAGAPIPSDRPIDGKNLAPLLLGNGSAPRDEFFYYRDAQLWAVRQGPYKAHFWTQSGYRADREHHNPPLLFNLQEDPSEQHNIAAQHPEIVRALHKLADNHLAGIESAENQLARGFIVVRPAEDGTIRLHAKQAVTHGPLLRYEPEPHKNTLGYWMRQQDWASWDFVVEEPGIYQVEILQGCGPGSGGSEVEFRVGSQAHAITVVETSHFQDFLARDIGTFEFSEPGQYMLSVRPLRKPGLAVMDLRQVTLTPAAAADPGAKQ